MPALDVFLSARSVAVVGASSHPEKVGHQILRNLIHAERGVVDSKRRKLYPVNPGGGRILDLAVAVSLSEVKEAIDLIIIATPGPTVESLVAEIVTRNQKFEAKDRTKGVVIISAGFAEGGKAGLAVQEKMTKQLCDAGIHLLGPNTLGIIAPHQHLNASFAQADVPSGNIAFFSQSGAMLTAFIDAAAQREVGLSIAVSLGNKAELSEVECLEFAWHDHATDVIVLYLESLQGAPRLCEVASRVVKDKPILLLKGGTSDSGRVATTSHTAALATNQVLLTAAAKQVGITIINTLEELIDTSFFLAKTRSLPENVMVITNAGGPAVNTVDVLEQKGVPLAAWSKQGKLDLENLLPHLPAHNPLDLLGDASPQHFQFAVQAAQHDLSIDSVLIIVTPQAVTDMGGITDILIKSKGKKPMFVALVGGDHLDHYRQQLRQHEISCTPFPNDLVSILGMTRQIAAARYKTQSFVTSVAHHQACDPEPAPTSISQLPSLHQLFGILLDYGISLPHYFIVSLQNMRLLEKLKYPLFAKTANTSLMHKKEIGAIFGIVKNEKEARQAMAKLAPFGNEVLFQEVVDIDHELLLGVEHDAQFGPFLTIGLGGSDANVLADRAYALLPTNKAYLKQIWQSTKASQLLRDQPETTTKVLDAMWQLQKLIMTQPWIKGVEINPLVINQKGVWAADAKISVK